MAGVDRGERGTGLPDHLGHERRRERTARSAGASLADPGAGRGPGDRGSPGVVRRLHSSRDRVRGQSREQTVGNAAVFLDRDGVIIVDKGYVHLPGDVDYVDGIFEFCRLARGLGFRLIVATNQSGIARGLFSEADFLALIAGILDRFDAEGIAVDAVYFCPHHPTEGSGPYREDCSCRKPRPGMLLAALQDYRLAASRCAFLGDRQSDMEAAHAAGLGLKLLLQDRPGSPAAPGDVVRCASIAEAGAALETFAGGAGHRRQPPPG